jgi:transaldolase
MTRLQDLHDKAGQSPWLDNLKRSYLTSGRLADLVDAGVRGLTSNPTIMAKAIGSGNDYDEEFIAALDAGKSVEEAYWDLVISDVNGALEVLRPVYDRCDGDDGFVSIEVAPNLAHDTARTIAAARSLHERIRTPNLLVKIPATTEGLPAIEAMIAEGRSVNVTLIFSIERYAEVGEAYLRGLESLVAAGGDPSNVASVASFFVSRVDTYCDRQLDEIAKSSKDSPTASRALDLRGKAAVAQARLAYCKYRELFTGERFEALKRAGAKPQRPLWASTSSKNPSYDDLVYVNSLIAPGTINTMPEDTLELYARRGQIEPISDAQLDSAQRDFEALAACGIDFSQVADVLEAQGVASFADSFDTLLAALKDKAEVKGFKA